mgnify:FL=1
MQSDLTTRIEISTVFIDKCRNLADIHLHHYGYGGGRRICPGIHLAERSMWRITAKLLWAFEFEEPIDPETGEVKHLDPNAYTSSNLVCPLPFDIRVKLRSAEHGEVIRRELANAEEFLSQYN